MPSYFTLRMQFGLHQDPEQVTEQLLRLVREAPVDEIMFFYFAEELNDGHETLDGLQEWIGKSRPYREALKKAGISVSLNPWHSVLHCDRGRALKSGQDWQSMVDPTGREASAVVCALDANWRDYFFKTLELYAQEGFRTVWIDDDIRYHNHPPLHWGGCFCPLHVAEFNKRAGVSAVRQEIVSACLQPGTPHPWRAIWMDMWQETVLAFLHECQQILDKGGARMGLMSSSMEAHGAEGRRWEEWWDVFGNGQPPVHRPHFWSYSDGIGPQLIHSIAALDQNRSIQPTAIDSGPEIECMPYGRWNKSFRQIFAQMALAHVLGSTHLNISLYDFMGNRPDDEPERATFLKRVRPSMDWLADRFPTDMKSVGVGVPWTQHMGRLVHTGKGTSWFELECACKGWSNWLGAAGIAFSARPQQCVNALAGPMAWCIDDATLRDWLTSGLLVDGWAAAILAERGLGELIGVKSHRWITQDEVLYSVEECLGADFALRSGAQISVNEKVHTERMFQAELDEGATVVSDLRNPLQEVVGHGTFIFRNGIGGRVAVVPWDAGRGGTPLMDIHRAVHLRKVVAWLSDGKAVGSVENGAWLVPQFLSDGVGWRGAIWNGSPDETDAFHVRRPEGMPPIREAWHLRPSGERIAARVDGDVIRLNRPIHQWEVIVVD